MTGKELMRSVDKAVYVNERGQRAFSDVSGKFYLVGFSMEMRYYNGKRQAIYCGYISRTKENKRSTRLNADYIELLNSGEEY